MTSVSANPPLEEEKSSDAKIRCCAPKNDGSGPCQKKGRPCGNKSHKQYWELQNKAAVAPLPSAILVKKDTQHHRQLDLHSAPGVTPVANIVRPTRILNTTHANNNNK